MTDGISPKQFHESKGVEAWRVIGDGACAYGVEEHKPDVDLRHDGVTVRLVTCRSEPARHPGRDLDRGGHALLARRARV